MADSNANRSPRSEQPSANAPGRSEARLQAARPGQSQNQLVQSSGVGQVAGRKRGSEVSDLDPTDGYSGRVVMTTQDQVQNHFRRGRLVDMTDLSQHPARNLVVPGRNHLTGVFTEGHVMENQLLPIWRQQNGGVIPETLVSLTRLRPGARLQAQLGEHVGTPDNARLGLEPPEPARITAPQPPAEKQDKGKKKTRAERRRARREHERLERMAAQAASQRFSSHDGEDWRTDDFAESEGGDDYTGQNPPSQQEFNFELPAGAPSLPAPTCANCKQPDHLLSRCPGPVNEEGVILGCVAHNVMDHTYDDCPQAAFHLDYSHFHFLVEARAGLPAVRSEKWNWVDLAVQFKNRELAAYPLTRAYSLQLTQEAIGAYNFNQGASAAQLGRDPLTCTLDALLQHQEHLRKTEHPYGVDEVEEEREEVQQGQQPLVPQEDTIMCEPEDDIDYETCSVGQIDD
ncbi:hypothetical protein F4774DRAFT_425121 [Daldinia eschscholtzii]|nr:hypothetical protein F4774DRAFT_425121 [Daldinia eschscholtzii]